MTDGPLQATVRTFEPGDRSGTLLRDDGHALAFAGTALAPEVLLLRPGQRVRVLLEKERVALVCLPFT